MEAKPGKGKPFTSIRDLVTKLKKNEMDYKSLASKEKQIRGDKRNEAIEARMARVFF
jgi:hypothetical protein